jgi:hypothetical protein
VSAKEPLLHLIREYGEECEAIGMMVNQAGKAASVSLKDDLIDTIRRRCRLFIQIKQRLSETKLT